MLSFKNNLVMKITLIALGMSLFFLSAQAQTPQLEQFFNKYSEYENTLDITLKGWMLKGASMFSEDEDGKRILQKISKLRVLILEEGNLVSKGAANGLLKEARHDAFEDLMEIRDEGNKINFLIREDNKHITDVLMLLRGDEEFMLISLEGLLKFEDLNQIQFDVEGGEHFKKVPKKRPQA